MDREDELAATFPDQSHWADLTIGGQPIPREMYGKVSYWETDQGKGES